MASDEDYASFLDRANQDPGAGAATMTTKPSSNAVTTRAVDTDVPTELQNLDAYYVSESDEPFEPVSLKYGGNGIPDAYEFKTLISHAGEVSELRVEEFDRRGDYVDVVDMAKRVGVGSGGDVKVFRVDLGRARAEYWIVSLDAENGRIVGVKAKAVES